MNQLGRTGQRATDSHRPAAASERGAWQPVGQGPQQNGPQQRGPQQRGPQQWGPPPMGPRVPGPRHPSAGPYAAPQQPQFPQPGPPYAGRPAGFGGTLPPRPPLGAVPAPPAADAAPVPPRRRGRVGRWIGVAVVVAALGGVGWYVTVGAPAPVTAAVGDCMAQTGENDLKVVGCGEASAQFTVTGKVEDKTMIAASLFACSDFPTATSSFWQGVEGKPGTVLCLAPRNP